MTIGLIAQPWWVNLLALVPPLAWFSWRRGGVPVTVPQLVISGVFAGSFGFLEAVVVVYLRAAVGLLPGYQGALCEVTRFAGDFYPQSQANRQFPESPHPRSPSRGRHHPHAPQRGFAYLCKLQGACRGVPLDLCHLGHRLLRRPLGHRKVAPFAPRSRYPVPHSRALAFPGMVSAPGKRPRPRRRPPCKSHAIKELSTRWPANKLWEIRGSACHLPRSLCIKEML